MAEPYEAENKHLLKHLDFIQVTLVRMAANSFVVKGWSVTFVAAILAFTNKDGNRWGALVALLPAVLFWRLDGYFLMQERLFRKLYDDVRKNPLRPASEVDFSLDTSKYQAHSLPWYKAWLAPNGIFRCMMSKTIWGFYLVLISVVLVVFFIAPSGNGSSPATPSSASTTTATSGGAASSATRGSRSSGSPAASSTGRSGKKPSAKATPRSRP